MHTNKDKGMFLIVGLGNPGEQYTKNRHNVGFQSVKYLADRHGWSFNEKHGKARIATGAIHGQRVTLAKPFTYMNASGEAVAPLVRWHKLDVGRELLVVYDDLDLPFGTLRLRATGSAGGQKGMQSIIGHLGTFDFARLRVGIGRPPAEWDTRDFVLGNWSRAEVEHLPELYTRVADAIELFVAEGIIAAMNRFNVQQRGDATNKTGGERPSKSGASDRLL
jgi:peptidyl-tRNA hydrolase, PTH1 family